MSATTDKVIEIQNRRLERGRAFVERCRRAIIEDEPFEIGERTVSVQAARCVVFLHDNRNDDDETETADMEFYTQQPQDILEASQRIVWNVYGGL